MIKFDCIIENYDEVRNFYNVDSFIKAIRRSRKFGIPIIISPVVKLDSSEQIGWIAKYLLSIVDINPLDLDEEFFTYFKNKECSLKDDSVHIYDSAVSNALDHKKLLAET